MIEYKTGTAEDVLRFQIERHIKTLMRHYLVILEELGQDHDEALDKLYKALPEEYKVYVDLADYLDEEKGIRMRKKILDHGNDAIRGLNEVLKGFEVKIKN